MDTRFTIPSAMRTYGNRSSMPTFLAGPPVAPMQYPPNPTSQTTNVFYRDSRLHHPPSLTTLPWNDPRVTYTPGHYTPRNLRQDHLLQSNEYHRRRVEAVIEHSADFQWNQLHDVQEDDDLMYCFTPKPHVRLIEAWVEIFLTTPQCYLMMALEEVRTAFFEQTTRVPNAIHVHGQQLTPSAAHSLKRKAVMAEDNFAEEYTTESRKRSRNEDTAPTSEQSLSFWSSSDSERVSGATPFDSTAQDHTTTHAAAAATAYATVASTTPVAPAIPVAYTAPVASIGPVSAVPVAAVAPQGQLIVPAVIPPVPVAVQSPLADPIAAMMARFPTRNTVDISGRGCKGVAMSRGQIRAHFEIEGRTLATLPTSANSDDRHEMRGVAPPRTVDPTLINCVTTAPEMLTFLPYQTVNYELWDRIRKSWAPKEIADFMAYARQLQNPRSYHRTTFHHDRDGRPDDVPTHTFTTNVPSNMSTRGKMDKKAAGRPLHDYFLYHLGDGDGVVNYPTGRDAQLLTRCVQHVRNVSHDMNVRISEIVQYAARHGITVPAADVIQPDTNVVVEDTPSRAFLDMIDRDFVRRHGRSSGIV